jgi:hypothetical protein
VLRSIKGADLPNISIRNPLVPQQASPALAPADHVCRSCHQDGGLGLPLYFSEIFFRKRSPNVCKRVHDGFAAGDTGRYPYGVGAKRKD